MSEIVIPDDLNLYDAEVQKITELLLKLQYKYATRRATFDNLKSLSEEAMDVMEKAGFIATVATFDENMQPKLPPVITIHGRVEVKEFDPDRQQWEVKKEVADEEVVSEFLKKGGTKKQKVDIEATIEPTEHQVEE